MGWWSSSELFGARQMVLLGHESGLFSTAMLLAGLLVNAEVIAIMALSPRQPVDIASLWVLPRRGETPRPTRSAMLGD